MVGGRRVIRGWVAALVVVAVAGATAASGGAGAIKSPDLRDWLTYISSDELEGRAVFTDGLRTRGWIHRGSPPRVGRQAGRRPWVISADCPRARGEDDFAIDRQRDRQRRDANVRRRRGHHVSQEHGRQAAVHGGPRGVRRLRSRRAGREPRRFSRQGRAGCGGRLARDERPEEHRSQRVPARAQRTQPLRDRAAWRGGEHRPDCRAGRGWKGGRAAGTRGREGRRGRSGGSGRRGGAAGGGGGRGAPLPTPDFTTVQRLDAPVPPNVSANDAFFDFPLQPGAGEVRGVEAPRLRAGRTAVVSRARRDDHVQRGCGLSDRPHAADQERRRYRRRRRSRN